MADDKKAKQDPKPIKSVDKDAQQKVEREDHDARERDTFDDNPLIFRGMD